MFLEHSEEGGAKHSHVISYGAWFRTGTYHARIRKALNVLAGTVRSWVKQSASLQLLLSVSVSGPGREFVGTLSKLAVL